MRTIKDLGPWACRRSDAAGCWATGFEFLGFKSAGVFCTED
jgi:hypothetical protein